MTLPIYDTGLLCYGGTPMTQEGILAVGDGKFVVIAHGVGPNDDVGFVVIQLDQDGNPTFGSTGYFTGAIGNTNPLAYWDKSNEKIVIFYDEYPANKYLVASVSGMTLTEDGRSTLSSSNSFHYAVEYSEVDEKAILCSYLSSPQTVSLYTLTLSGTSLIESEAVSGGISGRARNDNCKITISGTNALLAIVFESAYPEPEVRVLSNIDSAGFDYSSGYTLPVASHPYCIGLAGTSDGLFTGYWAESSSSIPYLIAGNITEEGVLTFGNNIQYAGPDWGDYFGDFIGSGVGLAQGVGVFAQRIDRNKIHMFTVENVDQVVSVGESDTSVSGLSLYNYTYDHVPIRYDFQTGYAVCAFSVINGSNADIYIAVFPAEAPEPPVPVFWTNHTLQRERLEKLDKKATNTVIPGDPGRPYIPPVPSTPTKVVVEYKENQVCERVI